MSDLSAQLTDLNTRAATLTGQDSSIPEATRLMQSLGHQFRLEKASSYNEIQMEISRKLSNGGTVDEVIAYLKGLYEAGKDIKLPAGSKFDEIKEESGDNWKKYFLAKAAGEMLGEIGRPTNGAVQSQFQKVTEPLINQLKDYNDKKADVDNYSKLIADLGAKSFADIAELRTYLEELGSTSTDESVKRVVAQVIGEIDSGAGEMTDAEANTIGNTPGMPSNAPDSNRVAIHNRIIERVKTELGNLKSSAESEMKKADEALKGTFLAVGSIKSQEEAVIAADLVNLKALVDSVEKRTTTIGSSNSSPGRTTPPTNSGNAELEAAWKKLEIEIDFATGKVTKLSSTSPLYIGGLREGDTILSFNEVREKYSSSDIASVSFEQPGTVNQRRADAQTVALAFSKGYLAYVRYKRDGEDGKSFELIPKL